MPSIVRWTKPHLGRFDERALCGPKDSEASRDLARIGWLEGSRLGVSVIAVLLDRLHGALADSAIREDRTFLGQEQDNVEYVLSLLPRLLDSYRELESPVTIDALQRHRSSASVVTTCPTTFPSSYPFSLLAYPPFPRDSGSRRNTVPQPNIQHGLGEIGAVIVVMLLLAPPKILANFFEGAFEVEGSDNFARFLSQLFRVARSILDNVAWPPDWLNITILAHTVFLKMATSTSDILQHEYIPAQQLSYNFNFALWRDFFAMLLRLLASEHLVIEEFSPQKRRAVWRRRFIQTDCVIGF